MQSSNLITIRVITHTAFVGKYLIELELSESACLFARYKYDRQVENKVLIEKYYLYKAQISELISLLENLSLPLFPKKEYDVFDGSSHSLSISSEQFDFEVSYYDGLGVAYKSVADLLLFIFSLIQNEA